MGLLSACKSSVSLNSSYHTNSVIYRPYNVIQKFRIHFADSVTHSSILIDAWVSIYTLEHCFPRHYIYHSLSLLVSCLQALQQADALHSVGASKYKKIRSTISDGSWDTKSNESRDDIFL